MIEPERCWRMIGRTCLQAMMVPRRLMALTRSKAASVISVGRGIAAGEADADVVVQDVDAAPQLHGLGDGGLQASPLS